MTVDLLESIPPLYFVNVMVGITLAACIGLIAFGRDRDLAIWAGGFALYPIAFLFFGLRNEIPQALSVVVGNGSLALMFALFTEGMCRLYGFRVSRLLIWVPPALAVAGFFWLYNNAPARIVLGTVVMVYHSLMVLYIVTRSLFSVAGRGKWIIFFAVALYSLMFLARAVMLSAGTGTGTRFLEPGLTQTVYFTVGVVSLTMFAIGLLVHYKERAELAVWQLAQHDPLTQLGNRRVLQQRLDHLLARTGPRKGMAALMMLDLDSFKELNDTYGHALGDQLLVEVAYRLKDCVNECDTVVRLGGDEFVLLIENLGQDREQACDLARVIAQRILDKLGQVFQLQYVMPGSDSVHKISYHITASIGLVLVSGAHTTRETLLSQADSAMYQAKQSGKNVAVIHAD